MQVPNEALRKTRCPKGHDCDSRCICFSHLGADPDDLLAGWCDHYDRAVSPPNLRHYRGARSEDTVVR